MIQPKVIWAQRMVRRLQLAESSARRQAAVTGKTHAVVRKGYSVLAIPLSSVRLLEERVEVVSVYNGCRGYE